MRSASITKGAITWRTFAPRAIFTPISRVLSFTTAYMMLATPIPPTKRVRVPMIPRNIWIPRAMLPVMRWFSRVSQIQAHRLVDEVVELGVGEHGLEGGGGDGGLVLVGAAVHSHHDLCLHHAHHEERGLVDQDGLARHVLAPEEVPGQLLAQEDDPALLPQVQLVQEAPARLRDQVPQLAELRVHAAHAGVHGLGSRGEADPTAVLAGEGLDLGDARAQQDHVLVRELDGPAGGETHERLRGGSRSNHSDTLPHAPGALVERALHALAEGEQQHDGERPPRDGQYGQGDALPLMGDVVLEQLPDEGDLGLGEHQASFRATTGSSMEARRAGK